jgi:DNA polymerase-3 subunit alpha
MAFVQIEDLTAQVEGIVFPDTYDRIHEHLQVDARLIAWGKADRRDDTVQMIIDDVEPIETVRMVMVELTPKQAGNIDDQHQLRTILQAQMGEKEQAKVPIVAAITAGSRRQFVRLGNQFRVKDYQATVNALQQAGFSARASSVAGG